MNSEKSNSNLHAASTFDATPDASPLPWTFQTVAAYLASFAMTVFATTAAIGIDNRVHIPNISLVFVVPVIVAAIGLGLGPSLASAILGALAYNFFLVEPRYSLAVSDPANVWAIGLLFVVGIAVSGVAFTSRRRSAEAMVLNGQATVLRDFSREALGADGVSSILAVTARALQRLFSVPVVVMLVNEGKVVSVKRLGDIEPREAELEAIRSSLETRTVVHAGLYPDLASRFDSWPVVTKAGPCAALGLAFNPDQRPAEPGRLVEIVAAILALSLDRAHCQTSLRSTP